MSPLYKSYAKINLHLEVLGRRTDGYHELRTVFQSVDLADEISIEEGSPGVRLEVPGGGAPEGETNLAHRAADLFLKRWAPNRGVRIRLVKRIPSGGGLGGGSSNAATVLMALRELFDAPVDETELVEVARRIGADVAFFLVGGTALGVGRGDRINPLPDLPEVEMWLVTPSRAVSTGEVFGRLELPMGNGIPDVVAGWLDGQPKDWAVLADCRNDLEETVLLRYPEVRKVYNALLEAGASLVRLSGSGSTLFARFSGLPTAAGLSEVLPNDSSLLRVRTLTRKELRRLGQVD